MRIRHILLWFAKALIAGIIALSVVSGLCFAYSKPAIRTNCTDGATEYKYPPNAYTATMTEGVAFNQTDKNGYYNAYPQKGEGDVDILLMGSSHMEATNVAPTENTAYLLNEHFPEMYTYNIGLSGHTPLHCVSNLSAALQSYRPGAYVVIEIMDTDFSVAEIDAALEGTALQLPVRNQGIVGMLQKIPYLRLAYSQMELFTEKATEAKPTSAPEVSQDALEGAYHRLISYVAETAQSHGVTAVFAYHGRLNIGEDGTVAAAENPSLQLFKKQCEENGVLFADATGVFLDMYAEHYVLPHGFSNGPVGKGHLNRYGHQAFAQTITEAIEQAEVAK